jgi:hypothetical protein
MRWLPHPDDLFAKLARHPLGSVPATAADLDSDGKDAWYRAQFEAFFADKRRDLIERTFQIRRDRMMKLSGGEVLAQLNAAGSPLALWHKQMTEAYNIAVQELSK